MEDVRVISLDNGRVALVSPYNSELPAAARELGGRWDRTARYWHFDARDEQRVRELARDFFGTDGSPADEADKVTIRWNISNYCQRRGDSELHLGGHRIASRRSRDEDVRLGVGVVLISGGFPGQGGSTKYPALEPLADTVVEIRDLPRALLDNLHRGAYEIVETTVDVAALREERERLLARIAEIDATLAAHGTDKDRTSEH
ncbi:hypothetical protein OIE69_43785 (plasmid) [Actinacidiphila glaucinigra]|uniref:hypothetical protein n=1 Tax=Actinacidiphila glaucinigra TaxID=235986 RepID=UPI002DD9ADD3|nr:hypothetical protein [Actinacidiphila glaucinigra]WSD65829.1 hypothetical protein OIE69_43785 [Actinacidiphila glaucinigra]